LSSKTAKELFEALWDNGGTVDTLIEELGLKQMSDTGELEAIVVQIMTDNPDQVEQLREGKDKVLGFFVGQVMKATKGKANPKQVNELIRKNI
jgi:aspartyl-tRNA(Asn)/glutamyl-tRNA(Gln) amidotransferase subunit B